MTRYPLLVFVVLLTSCASLGTKTLYNADNKGEVRKIGFSKLDGNSIVIRIFPKTDSIFRSTFVNTVNKFNLPTPFFWDNEISIEKADTGAISRICKENNLDGLIVTKLKFINTSYSVYFVPIGKSYDTQVEMKLFSNNGNLLYGVKYNTMNGNSYLDLPTADRTVHDGIVGAINKIAKGMGWKK